MKLPCFCISCDKELKRDWDGTDIDSPTSGGIYLTSHGNYGSVVFDPVFESDYLEMYICDECLVKKAKNIYSVRVTKVKPKREITTLDKKLENDT